jgi:hypothetical protein
VIGALGNVTLTLCSRRRSLIRPLLSLVALVPLLIGVRGAVARADFEADFGPLQAPRVRRSA